MNGEAIMTVTVAVVSLVQLAKWAGVPQKWAPAAVFLLAALGVGLWCFSQGSVERAAIFGIFAAWVAVSTAAAGVFGFVRQAAETLTATAKK